MRADSASAAADRAAALSADHVLRDGGSVHVRAIRAEDKARLVEHFAKLSAQSVYFRFFRVKKRLSDDELRQFTELDFRDRVALVATLRVDGEEEIIGVGRYAVVATAPGAPRRAEVAFAVVDAQQGRGVASLLLEHLAGIARAQDIAEFEADVLGDNSAMLVVFGRSGYRVTRALADGVFHLTFPTETTPESLALQARRERVAAAESVRGFMQPRAVAVVGASNRRAALGAVLLEHLRGGGFTGPVYAVHPSAEPVAGHPAWASVAAIGQPVDLALIAVPAAAVEAVVADCAAAGVRAVLVVSGGFAETGAAGRAAQERLAHLVRASGMRLVGPNSVGVVNTDPAFSLNASLAAGPLLPGTVGLLSQSGALGLALLDRCAGRGIGLSSFVAVGNKADVSGNDLLAYWNEDARTRVVLLYLEHFGNPRRFARLAPVVGRTKPVVAVTAGRVAAAGDVAVDALFAQAGVIRADTLGELLDVAALLATQPVPAGPRVGAVSNTGALATLFADAGAAAGLVLPALALAGGAANPIDLLDAATPAQYVAALTELGAAAAVDAVVAIYVSPRRGEAEAFAAAIAVGAAAVPAHKPVLVVFLARGAAPQALHGGGRGRLPVYEFPEGAARALAAAARYAAWRQRPAGTVLELDAFAETALRALVDRCAPPGGGGGWLAPADVAALLGSAGITTVAAAAVAPGDADGAVQRLGAVRAFVAVRGDPTFGALVTCGLGGEDASPYDTVTRLPPVSDVDADAMLAALHLAPRLAGGDRAALLDVIRRVSALVEVVPELQELHLDPIAVLAKGAVVVAARARLG